MTKPNTFVNDDITTLSNVYAEPVITVYGSGTITLMVGTTIRVLEDINRSIAIDSVLQEACQGTTLMNEHMTGEFPVLNPGANAVSWTGGCEVSHPAGWRYL